MAGRDEESLEFMRTMDIFWTGLSLPQGRQQSLRLAFRGYCRGRKSKDRAERLVELLSGLKSSLVMLGEALQPSRGGRWGRRVAEYTYI
eukprot:scaffold322180_cov26-Prasinocladus_malaysianus.AAC.1